MNYQKLIGAIVVFASILANGLPTPINTYVLSAALALSGGLHYYYGGNGGVNPAQANQPIPQSDQA